jgi:hypothetical protein
MNMNLHMNVSQFLVLTKTSGRSVHFYITKLGAPFTVTELIMCMLQMFRAHRESSFFA